jgi:hypothetical protein
VQFLQYEQWRKQFTIQRTITVLVVTQLTVMGLLLGRVFIATETVDISQQLSVLLSIDGNISSVVDEITVLKTVSHRE